MPDNDETWQQIVKRMSISDISYDHSLAIGEGIGEVFGPPNMAVNPEAIGTAAIGAATQEDSLSGKKMAAVASARSLYERFKVNN